MFSKPNPGDYERLVVRKLEEGIGEAELQEAITVAEKNLLYSWLLKEGIYADYAQALGGIHDLVVNAAVPKLVGRELVSVIPTTKDPTRFIKAIKGKAWWTGQAPTPITPERYTYQDVSARECKAGALWSETLLEDAEWNVEQRLIEENGRSVGEEETTALVAMYNAIAAANLAGGAELTISAPITWAEFEQLCTRVENANFVPKVVGVSTTVYGELKRLDQFIHALYYAPERAIRTGVVETTLGVKVVHSSLITKSLAIDTDYNVLTVRRELNSKPWEDPKEMLYGALANERVGMASLRNAAVARGTR